MFLSFRLFFVTFGIAIVFPTISSQATITEDSRLTFAKGLLAQINSRIQTDRKATVPELMKVYQDRLAKVPSQLTDEATTEARRKGLELLIEAIYQLSRNGVTPQALFGEVRLANPSEEQPNLDIVVWYFPIPPDLKTDQPSVKAVRWKLILIDQNRLDATEGQPPQWRLLGIDKQLISKSD